ncbi:MAG: GNAT family N-acetyltransferase [Bacteroidota bacterium]
MGLKATIYPATEISHEDWDAFIASSRQGGVYLLHGYLSAVTTGWEALILTENDQWVALMPIKLSKKVGFTAFLQQPYSQYWGICFHPELDQSTYSSLSKKRKAVLAILKKLPKIDLFIQQFSPHFDYPLPFHWGGYTLHTRYTYQLPLEGYEVERENETFGQVWEGFSAPLRRQVNKAEKNGVSVRQTANMSDFSSLTQAQLSLGHDISGGNPASMAVLARIGSFLRESGKGFILLAEGPDEKVLAAAIFSLFEGKLVYLAGVYDGSTASSGAMSLLMWRGIQTGMQKGAKLIDFEGSMIAGIETFFRKFGAYPVPYLQIRKNSLPLILRWLKQ